MGDRSIVVMHGCCKGAADQESVEQESRTAALAVGAQSERVLTPYYTCELNRRVIAGGHPAALPKACSSSAPAQEGVDHDDSDWDQAIEELLEDPVNRLRLAKATDFTLPEGELVPEGWLPGVVRKWADVHTFLTRGHQPQGKQAVLDAVQPTFDKATESDYVLIAHSLGSIISGYLIGYGVIKPPKVFVTVGSQLGWSALLLFGWLKRFHLDGTWINVIDRDDPSAGFFTKDNTPADNGFTADVYQDAWVENPHPNPHDLVGYMSTGESMALISPLL